jgi:hypothetical protein
MSIHEYTPCAYIIYTGQVDLDVINDLFLGTLDELAFVQMDRQCFAWLSTRLIKEASSLSFTNDEQSAANATRVLAWWRSLDNGLAEIKRHGLNLDPSKADMDEQKAAEKKGCVSVCSVCMSEDVSDH